MKVVQQSATKVVVGFPGSATPLRTVLRGTVWNGLSVAAARFVPGILTILLAWWIEPSDLGVISFVLAYYGIFSLVADWSVAYAVQKLIPENPEHMAEVAWTALFVRLGFSAVLGLACWGLDDSTGIFHGYGDYLALLLVASAFGIIVSVHNARCEFAAGSLFSVGFQLAWLGLAVVLVKEGMPVRGPLLALALSFAAVGIPGFVLNRELRRRVEFLWPVARQILHFGLWATLATVLNGFAGQVGILVVAYINGDAAAGVFKVATTFGVLPALLGMIVVMPLMPVAKRELLNGGDVSESLVLMVGLPLVTAGFVLAPAVISTFVSASYLGAVWPMRILLGASLLRTLVTAVSGVLFVGQGLKELARIEGAVAAVTLIGGILLSRTEGLIGMAVALLAAWFVGAVLLYRWFERRAPLGLEWRSYLRYAGSAVLMATLVFFGIRLVPSPVERFLLGGVLATVIYASLLWMQQDLPFQSLVRGVRQRAVG